MIGFFVVIIILLSLSFTWQNNFDFLSCCDEILVVSNKHLDGQDYIIKNGQQYYYKFDSLDSFNDKDYIAYNFYFNNTAYFNDIVKNFSFLYRGNSIENYQIYYGYYDGYFDFRYIDGKKINVQVVVTDKQLIVGFPLVVTGY